MLTKQIKKPRNSRRPKPNAGFTLIEILVVIGIIAILASVVLVAVNPARQFAQARNSERQSAITTILDAIDQNMVDNGGTFNCPVALPNNNAQQIESNPAAADLWGCIVPTYLSTLPLDPTDGMYVSNTMYKTGYYVIQDGGTGQITVSAPNAELGQTISITR